MATIAEVEELASKLTDAQRAILAANLLQSLPSILDEEDEGIEEALRRDAELEANPDSVISLDQLDRKIASRRP